MSRNKYRDATGLSAYQIKALWKDVAATKSIPGSVAVTDGFTLITTLLNDLNYRLMQVEKEKK